jgi:NapC/NirT cytochrome c family, N-terminal region/Cytochrome c3
MKPLKSTWQNPLTETGAVLAILAVFFFISFQLIEAIAASRNPYTGLWSFLVIPAVLVLGLLLIPLGWLLERRKRRKRGIDLAAAPRFPRLDMNDPRHRKGLVIFGLGTLVAIPLIGISSYEGYHYTDSTEFCGQVCHAVMHPEYTSYRYSPHARVSCAECHIGPGATWFVKAKISGVRQIFAVAFDTYSRPIPTPVKDLRPARETCEQCHWPEKFFGSQLRTRVHFASDETNTRSEFRMVVKTGGGDSAAGRASGIHWHMALSNKIEYIATDRGREVIPWVRHTDPAGRVTIFRSDGMASTDPRPQGELRQIDCVDCHNRPTHIIQPPAHAVDIALETGRLDRTLPYIKKATVEALTGQYSSEDEADRKIEASLRAFYQKVDGKTAESRKGAIDRAVAEAQSIYHRSFFPRMKVDWRAYPDHIGHMIFDGCFRCHDNKHVSEDRRVIRKDCHVCHDFQQPVSGTGSQDLFRQGDLEHPVKLDSIHSELKCSLCHTGGRAPETSCAGCHVKQQLFAHGKTPVLMGLENKPSSMADVDCESCHDLSKPQTAANLAAQCETCHEKGYGELMQLWKDEAAAGRAKAYAALAQFSRTLQELGNREPQHRDLLGQMQAAFDEIDQAGALHNPELAGAVYEQIAKLVEQRRVTTAKR